MHTPSALSNPDFSCPSLAGEEESAPSDRARRQNPGSFIFDVLDLEIEDYGRCLDLQKKLHKGVCAGTLRSTLLLCQHNPVITLGRQAKRANILKPEEEVKGAGVSIVNTNRGGDVTLHLPGQLVAYPVFDLNLLGRDIRIFLRNLEKTVVLLLNDYHIRAGVNRPMAGVWVGGKKIASIGIAISRWVTYHGLSLNVDCGLDLFSLIKPCGEDIMMTSIVEKLAGAQAVSMAEVKTGLIDKFKKVFKTVGDIYG